MDIIILLIILVILVVVAVAITINNRYVGQNAPEHNTDEILKRYIDKEEVECQNRQREKAALIENADKTFLNIGWTEWDTSIHCADGQLDRIRRASFKEDYRLVCYNPHTGNAKILSKSGRYYLTNGHRCSCPDFRERGLPCKHMYFLASVVPNYKEISNLKKGNSLKGLKFCICGRGQATVKEYITAHGGEIGNIFIRETSAVILASDIESSVVATAREHNMEILTFEQLQTLYSDNQS